MQREHAPAPTQSQLVKALGVFDAEKSSTLPLDKLKGVIQLFDGVELKAAIKNAKVAPPKDGPKPKSSKQPVDYHDLVENYIASKKKAEAKMKAKMAQAVVGKTGGPSAPPAPVTAEQAKFAEEA